MKRALRFAVAALTVAPAHGLKRFTRVAVLGALVAAVGIGTALPAHSLNPQTWTWVVDCRDADGVNTTETLGTTLPSGVYLVSVEGACSHTGTGLQDLNVGTPCTVPLVGPVPCTTAATIHNVPAAACSQDTTAGINVVPCSPALGQPPSCFDTVLVDGQCLVSGTVGLVTHGANTGMTARFLDTIYGDNTGFFVVTAALTPL